MADDFLATQDTCGVLQIMMSKGTIFKIIAKYMYLCHCAMEALKLVVKITFLEHKNSSNQYLPVLPGVKLASHPAFVLMSESTGVQEILSIAPWYQ